MALGSHASAVEYYGTGRRKTSTARVFLRPGSGAVTINHKGFDTFFPSEALRTQIKQPLVLTETADKFDVLATVAGGGVSGQAGAVRLGIARALVGYNGELRKPLKTEGLLTRDARAKERKKYGMAGARKRFQFSKR
jgi:small subunit ribosomal protein S9